MSVYEGDGIIRNGSLTGRSFADRSICVQELAQLGHPDQPHATMALPFVIHKDCSAASDPITIIATTTFALKVLDVIVECTGANGGGTITLKSGSNAITDAIVCAVDTTVTRAGTINDAYQTVAAGGSLVADKNAAGDKGLITIIAVRA